MDHVTDKIGQKLYDIFKLNNFDNDSNSTWEETFVAGSSFPSFANLSLTRIFTISNSIGLSISIDLSLGVIVAKPLSLESHHFLDFK